MKHVIALALGSILAAGVGPAAAQSLADVARQEQERRKAITQPAKVYTDEDAQKHAPLTTAAARPQAEVAAGQEGAAATAAAASGEQTGQASAAAAADAAPADEAGWRARIKTAEDGLARSRRLLEALEQQAMRAAILSANAAAAGQPLPASADDAARTEEIERLRAEVDKFTATLGKIQDDARRAGVPPGWVR